MIIIQDRNGTKNIKRIKLEEERQSIILHINPFGNIPPYTIVSALNQFQVIGYRTCETYRKCTIFNPMDCHHDKEMK